MHSTRYLGCLWWLLLLCGFLFARRCLCRLLFLSLGGLLSLGFLRWLLLSLGFLCWLLLSLGLLCWLLLNLGWRS